MGRLPLLAGALAVTLPLAGCDSPGAGSSGPGGVSEGEARALDDAASMLEERELPEGVLPPTGADVLPPEDAPETPAQEENAE
ncbi:hypothetical protein [Erythrobacter sp. NAP1]|uniref:hypothetical protein n=1 Tax=Erythrobacter sp. NAP1 TaxID=237727 RepID=UPI00138A0FC4|nr:hypothetical protein [Erythrobacter sp. NAP1]